MSDEFYKERGWQSDDIDYRLVFPEQDAHQGGGSFFHASAGASAVEAVERNEYRRERLEYEQRALRNERMLQAISTAHTQFLNAVDVAQVFNVLLQEYLELTESEFGLLGEFAYASDGYPRFYTHATVLHTRREQSGRRLDDFTSQGLAYGCFKSLIDTVARTEVACVDIRAEGSRANGFQGVLSPEIRSWVGIPLFRDNELIGIVCIANGNEELYTRLERDFKPMIGTFAQLLHSFRTDQRCRNAETELRISHRTFRSILNNREQGLILFNREGRVQAVNATGADLFGYAQADLLGSNIADWMTVADGADILSAIAKHEDKIPAAHTEAQLVSVQHRDGMLRSLSFSVETLNMNGHKIYVGLASPYSRNHHLVTGMNNRRRESDRPVSSHQTLALSNVNHEFRTPLTGIIGFAEVLKRETTPELREMAEFINLSGRRLLGTLNALMDYSGLEAGTYHPKAETLDVVEEVREKVFALEALARRKGLEIHVEAAESSIQAQLDRVFLERILNHLIENAIKFTHRGTVLISTRRKRFCVEISVMDTGVGISQEFLPYVFDEFRQESVGTTRQYEGCGLGLTVTHRLVHLMGGSIHAHSIKGKGSTFTVTFPLS